MAAGALFRMTDKGGSCQDIGSLRLRRCKRRTASAQDACAGGARSPVSWTRSPSCAYAEREQQRLNWKHADFPFYRYRNDRYDDTSYSSSRHAIALRAEQPVLRAQHLAVSGA